MEWLYENSWWIYAGSFAILACLGGWVLEWCKKEEKISEEDRITDPLVKINVKAVKKITITIMITLGIIGSIAAFISGINAMNNYDGSPVDGERFKW
ncbi:MAG: hypothetical protein LBN08_01645 [Lactobacillales bacterium]|jgi:intergrase/recombinase|nr:hypothetical protein [Lactobacillales bacterium]